MKQHEPKGKDVVSMIWSMASKSWADDNKPGLLDQANSCQTDSISLRRLARATGVDRSTLRRQLVGSARRPVAMRYNSFPYLWALLTTLGQPVPETIERAEHNLREGIITTLPFPIYVYGICDAYGEMRRDDGIKSTGKVLQLLRDHIYSNNISIREIARELGCDRTVIQRSLRLVHGQGGAVPIAAKPRPSFARLYDIAKIVGVPFADVIRAGKEVTDLVRPVS